jgi:hypothetical protein
MTRHANQLTEKELETLFERVRFVIEANADIIERDMDLCRSCLMQAFMFYLERNDVAHTQPIISSKDLN